MPRVEDYRHQPILQVRLEWRARARGRERTLSLDLAVHPNNSGRIVINYPGYRGAMDGFADKHKKLASYMQGEGLGAIVRGKGSGFEDFNGFGVDTQLRKMIDYSLENSRFISGAQTPELLLIGTSAGGGAIAAIAHEYNAVSRILLMAPGDNMGHGSIERGLPAFRGEVYIVIGREDDVVGGARTGQYLFDLATSASRRELFVIENCDHNFKGEVNGRIMSEAPFYAFTLGERPNFPDPLGGMVLYK